MRWSIYAFIFITISVLVSTAAPNSPVGTWQTEILGSDHGVAYFTFDEQSAVSGYGITRDSLAPFTISGTWDYDAHNDVVTGFTMVKTNGSVAVSAHMHLRSNKLRGEAQSTSGGLVFIGSPARDVLDLSGEWLSNVKIHGAKMLESFTVSASTNMPAWFDLTGSGLSNGGTFNLTGSIVTTSGRHAAAFTLMDFGTLSRSATFDGKVVRHGRKLAFHGKTDDDKLIVFRAERQ